MDPTRIDHAFDPSTLKPGLYVTRSGAPGYPAARFLVESGRASSLEHFLPDGQIDLTFQVLGAKKNPAEGEGKRHGTIRVTKKWFKSRIREYANWRIAWWREAIQNSINPHTGNASRVDLICKEGPDGNWIVSCSDNGRGMTKDQIEDEEKGFLVFGGSGASEYGSMGGIGGFGEAKQLLIFPWLQYRVRTSDQEYIGSADQWDADRVEPRQGVLLEVIMPADSHTTPEDALHVLKRSWLPQVTFTLNGAVVATGMPTTGQPLDQVDGQGIIYSYPKIRNEAPELVVRKGGLWTFSKSLPPSAKHGIIVEVTGESTKMFTTNRDGFGYSANKLEQKLTEAIREISTEGRLRAKLKPVERIVRGTGKFSTIQKKEQELPQRSYEVRDVAGPLPPVRDASEGTKLSDEAVGKIVKRLEGFSEEDIAALNEVPPSEFEGSGAGSFTGLENLVQIATASPAAAMVILQVMNFKGQRSMDAAIRQMVWKPDFLLLKDADMAYSIPKKFTPEDMTPAVLRLTKTWTELCRFILISIGEEATYGVGFWFSTDAAAGYLYRKQEHWLLLNPHKDETRKEIWTPTKQEDLAMLWAMAIHEVSHMLVRLHQGYGYENDDAPPEPASHGSEMANEQTRLQAKLAATWMTVRKIASSIKLRGQVPGSEKGPARRPPPGKKPKVGMGSMGVRGAPYVWNAEASLKELEAFLAAHAEAIRDQTSESLQEATGKLDAFMSRLTGSTSAYDRDNTGYRKVLQDMIGADRGYKNGLLMVARSRQWDGTKPKNFKIEFWLNPDKLDGDSERELVKRAQDLAQVHDSEATDTMITWIEQPGWSDGLLDGITVEDQTPAIKQRPIALSDWDPQYAYGELSELANALRADSADPNVDRDEQPKLIQGLLELFMDKFTEGTDAQGAFHGDPEGDTGPADHLTEYGHDYSGKPYGIMFWAEPDSNLRANGYNFSIAFNNAVLSVDDIETLKTRLEALKDYWEQQPGSYVHDLFLRAPWRTSWFDDLPHWHFREQKNPVPGRAAYGELQVHALPKGRFGVVHAPTGTWLTRRQSQDHAWAIAKHFGTGGGQALLKAALAGDQGAMDAVSLAVSGASAPAKKRMRIREGKTTKARN